ncbi:MAG: 4a-hydroxytetrahydrobiopterin dehydratase [bacterium]|nr:4a-hydroxytetrahydrobiopterin dehydratase [bacterium]
MFSRPLSRRGALPARRVEEHPDIEFGWGYVKIRLMTHAVKGLSENDFIMAAKIDALG